MTMWLLAVTVFLIFVWIYIIISPNTRLRKFGEKIPGPKSYPLIGTTYLLFASKKTNLEIDEDLRAKYGTVCRTWMGNYLVVKLSDPNDMEVILSSSKLINKPNFYQFIEAWVGKTNLVLCNGDLWRVHRKLLTPTFHHKILETTVPMMVRSTRILCNKIAVEADGKSFDIEGYIKKITFDIICETAMGVRLETQMTDNNSYLVSKIKAMEAIKKRIFRPWLYPEIFFKISSLGKSYYKHVKILRSIALSVIKQRKKLLEENLIEGKALNNNNDDGGQTKQLKPFLDFLLTERCFTDYEIENEVNAFLAAGHDTMKIAVSFCLYNLAQHPDIQEKVVQEAQEKLLNLNKELTIQDFSSLKYLDNVIKESMRLHPPAAVIGRKVTEDIELPSGYTLPQGSIAQIDIFLAHRDSKYFPNPEKFIPERFQAKEDKIHPMAYIPFSAGPRNCIGQKFAMLEMKIIISLLLLEYQLLPDESAEPFIIEYVLLTLHSRNGLPIKIKKRIQL